MLLFDKKWAVVCSPHGVALLEPRLTTAAALTSFFQQLNTEKTFTPFTPTAQRLARVSMNM